MAYLHLFSTFLLLVAGLDLIPFSFIAEGLLQQVALVNILGELWCVYRKE